MAYQIKLDSTASSAVDSYLEYSRIVRGDDRGKPFTPKQYEEYKKRVFPMRLQNRVYVCWTNEEGMDCKLIGPETQCFCSHRLHQHKTDFPELPAERPISLPCEVTGCQCTGYHYVPMVGRKFVRCGCKHTNQEHATRHPHHCCIAGCKCDGFRTSYTCGCGNSAATHRMITENKQERRSRGHPVGRDTVYKAMGGITGFSSLLEGYQRLDDSGLGAPDEATLKQPITLSDHPFLRANVESIQAHKLAIKDEDAEADLAERMSAMRQPGETDMDYFERRYQERHKTQSSSVKMKKPAKVQFTSQMTKKKATYSDCGGLQISGSTVGQQNFKK